MPAVSFEGGSEHSDSVAVAEITLQRVDSVEVVNHHKPAAILAIVVSGVKISESILDEKVNLRISFA